MPTFCPATNPIAFNGGKSCCQFYRRRHDPDNCPGNDPLSINDVLECCKDGHIDCPDLSRGCKDHPLGRGKNNQNEAYLISSTHQVKMTFLLIETCPAHPTFRRLESDLGYYFNTDMPHLRYLDALEYCRTEFDMPTYFPQIKTIETLREASGAVRIAGGRQPFCVQSN